MKSLIAAFVVIISASAFACDQQEMQFIGKAVRVNRHSFNQNIKQVCSYEIALTMANSSITCPLVEGEVVGIRFVDANCNLTESSQISGVIVRRHNTFWVE